VTAAPSVTPAATATASAAPSTTATDATPATPSASASASTTRPALEETVLNIETIPSRSAVFLDGAKVGVSPLELKVPKSSDAIRLELRHPGYLALREQVVPNVNQRLRLTLTAARSAPVPSGTSSAAQYHKFE
jgi:hypothetical protein